MWIDGFIIEVYETWPLQLSVDASGELYHVGLLLETKITHQGSPVSASEVKAHRRIRINGTASGQRALIAESIELLS